MNNNSISLVQSYASLKNTSNCFSSALGVMFPWITITANLKLSNPIMWVHSQYELCYACIVFIYQKHLAHNINKNITSFDKIRSITSCLGAYFYERLNISLYYWSTRIKNM